jgi:hypothetical protein
VRLPILISSSPQIGGVDHGDGFYRGVVLSFTAAGSRVASVWRFVAQATTEPRKPKRFTGQAKRKKFPLDNPFVP